ncbi:smoothened, frizzled class receptor isoform X1 [Dermacentor variabilis]|uniref:smoothened, frizzled class receptor isoform X1 n=1 Tax=Dermacentor variabilis TaxID=34621 RepID=UPI003F5B96F5
MRLSEPRNLHLSLLLMSVAASSVCGELRSLGSSLAASSDARLKRHGSVVGDAAPPTQTSPTNASGDASLPLNHEHGARTASSAAGDEFRQLVTDKGRGAKAHSASRHHATPLDHHAWPSAEKCARPAKCEPLINATCFGAPLPYSHTTVELANDSSSQFEIQERLDLWYGLRQIPRCWAVVQPLLCAVYRPRCVDGLVTLPSHETCRLVRAFCRITALDSDRWPFFLRCQQGGTFASGCKDTMREIKFNTTSRCLEPLVGTPRETSWYPEVEGCGIGCRHPLLTEDERTSMRTFVGVIVALATVACLFAVLTFLIGWSESRQYPNVMVFYMNLCLLLMCVGWLAQFLPGAREDITCRRDGTLRSGEPSSGENLSCVAIFFLCYYFLLASLCWLVLLAYAWEHRLQQGSSPSSSPLQAKAAYFHLVAWSVPFVLFIIVMALGLVDGDPVSGICFVSAANPHARSALVLFPVTTAFFAASYFLIRELYKLVRLKGGTGDMINDRVRAKIQSMILRIGLFLVTAVLLVSCTYVCHIYEFRNRPVWERSLHRYVACRANVETAQSPVPELPVRACEPDARPSLAMLQLHLVAFLGACLALASWVLTSATATAWSHFWRRTILRQPSQDAPRVQRHKLVAEAFSRRHELNRGQGSISFHSVHDDPVGMNLDMNSVTSQDLSSTWAAALPGFLHRRGAVAGPTAIPPVRRYSSTSDVSRQLSLSVRRQSLDSQMSYQVAAEQQWLAAQRAIARHQRRKTRRERERLLHMAALHRPSPFPHSAPIRRGSDSSMQSLVAAATSSLQRGLHGASTISKPASVARATSTGDLNPGSVLSQNHLSLLRPSVVTQRRSELLINPPFTHGMSESGSTRMSMRNSITAPSNTAESINSSTVAANGTSATAQTSQPNPAAPQMPGILPGYPALAAANPYAAYLSYLNGLRLPGHPPPEATLPPFGYPTPFGYPGFPFYPPTLYPYGQGFASYPELDPAHVPLIPLHPMPDSSSETGFIPIITSDSDFTDAGIRSPHMLSAQRAVEERERVLAAAAMASPSRPQTHQETQTERKQETLLTPTPLRKAQSDRPAATQQQPETIEMREIKSGQSRWSNASVLSKARVSKSPPGQQPKLSSQASKTNTPLHRFSSVSPPVTQSPSALSPLVQQQRESVSPRCCEDYQAIALHDPCSSNNTQHSNLNTQVSWPPCHQQVHQGLQHCSCPLYGPEVLLHAPSHASSYLHGSNSGYQQGALCMDQYCTGLASGSTEPNTLDSTTSGHSNSDGPHSCHTYLFAPVESNGAEDEPQSFSGNGCTAQCPEQCHTAVAQPQEQFTSDHLATPPPFQHPPFSGCCEGTSSSQQQNLGPQGLTEPGFVSR